MLKNSQRFLLFPATAFLMVANQNCSPTSFNGSSTEASKTSASSVVTPDAIVPDVLGTVDFADLVGIDFQAVLHTPIHDTILKSETDIDVDKRIFASETSLTGPISANQVAHCTVNGSGADFTLLEKNLKAIKFATTSDPASAIPDIGSVTLVLELRNGDKKVLNVDTSTRSVVVTGVTPPQISAPDLVRQLLALSLKANCSANIHF